jgi:hypothetical protein
LTPIYPARNSTALADAAASWREAREAIPILAFAVSPFSGNLAWRRRDSGGRLIGRNAALLPT